MKKKIVALSAIIAIIAIAAIGGSLAYFMDSDEVTNTFTFGDVDIKQNEVFVQNSQLLPVINATPTDGDNYIEKKVTVSNIGENDAYVQTLVAVPAVLDECGVVALWDGGATALAERGWKLVDGDTATDGIQPKYSDVTIGGMLHNVYLYRYTGILPTVDDDNTTDKHITAESLQYVYINSHIDIEKVDTDDDSVADKYCFITGNATYDAALQAYDVEDELSVYVVTQGVQARGFADADNALDTAFPNHPW